MYVFETGVFSDFSSQERQNKRLCARSASSPLSLSSLRVCSPDERLQLEHGLRACEDGSEHDRSPRPPPPSRVLPLGEGLLRALHSVVHLGHRALRNLSDHLVRRLQYTSQRVR